jgi:hypothetical protein
MKAVKLRYFGLPLSSVNTYGYVCIINAYRPGTREVSFQHTVSSLYTRVSGCEHVKLMLSWNVDEFKDWKIFSFQKYGNQKTSTHTDSSTLKPTENRK